MFFCGWTWTSFLTIFLLHFASARKGSFLQYDAECPFLSDEEYEKRMIKRRCPATTPTPPPPTTTEKVKNISRLSKGAKRFMLKFVSLGKSRSASIQLNSHTSNNLTIMEGTFLSVHCSQSFTKKNKTVANVTWYFNGEPIKDDLVNWRMQPDPVNAELRITPVLAKLDNGYFECYIDDQWSGGLVLSVETTLEAIVAGYLCFLLGSLASLLFTIGACIYYSLDPELELHTENWQKGGGFLRRLFGAIKRPFVGVDAKKSKRG